VYAGHKMKKRATA